MGLEHIDYELTKACNLKCIHCSAEAGKGETPDVENIKRVLEEAKNLGLRRLGITGGEPFLFPNERNMQSFYDNSLRVPKI